MACEEPYYCDQPLSCDPVDAGDTQAAPGTVASENTHSGATIDTTDGGMVDGTLEASQDDRVEPIDEPPSSDSEPPGSSATTASNDSGAGAQSSTRDAGDGLPAPPTLPDASSMQADTPHSTGGALSDASPPMASSRLAEDANLPSTMSGPTWSAPSRLTTNSGGVVGARIALTAEGRGLVVWQPTDEDGAWSSSLLARTYDPATGEWSDSVEVVSGELNLQYRIFADGQDSFVLVWQNLDPLEVRSKRYDGANWSEWSTVVPGKALFDLAATSDGAALIGWAEYSEDDELYFVMARSWNPAFHAWNPREIVQTTASQASDVAVARAPDGAAFALWLELPDADGIEVWANHSTADDNAWDTSEQVGTSTQRERGSNLVVTEGGDLLVRWSGRFEGKLWNEASGAWGTLEMLGAYRDATMCGIGEGDALLLGRDAGSHVWSQYWNGSLLEPEVALTDVDSQAPLLACNETTGMATWSDEVRRWINETNEWEAAHHFEPGTALDIAISDTGEAMIARGVGSNGGSFSALEVEHFE